MGIPLIHVVVPLSISVHSRPPHPLKVQSLVNKPPYLYREVLYGSLYQILRETYPPEPKDDFLHPPAVKLKLKVILSMTTLLGKTPITAFILANIDSAILVSV